KEDALTVIEGDAVALEKAVPPPLLLASTFEPAVPEVWSQARNVTALLTVPLKPELGTRRSLVLESALSSRALVGETEPTLVQLEPPSVVYCQEPWLVSVAVRAMPVEALRLVSLTLPLMRADTRVPALFVSSWAMELKLLAPLSTGAALGMKSSPLMIVPA